MIEIIEFNNVNLDDIDDVDDIDDDDDIRRRRPSRRQLFNQWRSRSVFNIPSFSNKSNVLLNSIDQFFCCSRLDCSINVLEKAIAILF